MIRPTKTFVLYYLGAGLLLMSLMFLTAAPLNATKLILGIIPLIIIAFFGFTIWRGKRMEREAQEKAEKEKGD